MIEFASNIPVTRWATIAFQVKATFDDPTPVFEVIPLPEHTRGAVFAGFSEPIPGVVILTRYNFDFPLQVDERIALATFHILSIGTLAPFVPVPLGQIPTPGPGSDGFIEYVTVASDPPPPQFSPPTIIEIHAMVERVIPGLVSPLPP